VVCPHCRAKTWFREKLNCGGDAAAQFYEVVFGWKSKVTGPLPPPSLFEVSSQYGSHQSSRAATNCSFLFASCHSTSNLFANGHTRPNECRGRFMCRPLRSLHVSYLRWLLLLT
jgi:hypothetical protein